jgi:hypothetical protein
MSKGVTSFIIRFRISIPAEAGISWPHPTFVIPAKAGTSCFHPNEQCHSRESGTQNPTSNINFFRKREPPVLTPMCIVIPAKAEPKIPRYNINFFRKREPPVLTPMCIVIPAKAGTKKPTSNIKFLKSGTSRVSQKQF